MHRCFLILLSTTVHAMSVPTASTSRIAAARELMENFALRTGILEKDGSSGDKSQRYLWTDSFAVCNLLGLTVSTNNNSYKQMALTLVDLVHDHLGRYRADEKDPNLRRQWLSGMPEEIGRCHPTVAGLRIGKKLPERSSSEPYNEQLEWDRDGQYFHYLTKWMFALDQVARYEKNSARNMQAIELANAATNAFVRSHVKGDSFMYWKMSTDLSRPLVSSMGSHDSEDGYTTFIQLLMTFQSFQSNDQSKDEINIQMGDHIKVMKSMIRISPTADPLGLGGMLIDAYRLYLAHFSGFDTIMMVENILKQALIGLRLYSDAHPFDDPAHHRLAFRELGLAIGLHSVDLLSQTHNEKKSTEFGSHTQQKYRDISLILEALKIYAHYTDTIESFWQDERHQKERSWLHHLDINEVMLATSLCPVGFLSSFPSEN